MSESSYRSLKFIISCSANKGKCQKSYLLPETYKIDKKVSWYIHEPDDYLGFEVKKNLSLIIDNKNVSTLENRLRKTVPNNNFSKNILTVGDSFAFGWEVSDQETWQSCLNRELTHLNFLNGGNGSYGTAQAILRAKRLYKEIKPSSLVVQTLVGHNFYRDQLIRKQGLPKPYLLKDQKGEIKVIYPNFKIEKDFSYQKKQIPNFIDYLIVNTSLLKRFSNDSLAYKVWNNSYSKFTPNSNKFGNNHASIEEISEKEKF